MPPTPNRRSRPLIAAAPPPGTRPGQRTPVDVRVRPPGAGGPDDVLVDPRRRG